MRSPISFLLFFSISLSLVLATTASGIGGGGGGDVLNSGNVTDAAVNGSAQDSFADMFDRALQKEFPESEQSAEETDPGGFNNSVAEKQVREAITTIMKENSSAPVMAAAEKGSDEVVIEVGEGEGTCRVCHLSREIGCLTKGSEIIRIGCECRESSSSRTWTAVRPGSE